MMMILDTDDNEGSCVGIVGSIGDVGLGGKNWAAKTANMGMAVMTAGQRRRQHTATINTNHQLQLA